MTVTEPNITSPVEEAQPQKTSRWAAWRGMWFFPVAVLWMELVLRISTIGFDYPKGLLYTFGYSLAAGVLLALLAVVTAYLVDGSFNPFLYFRF